MKFIKNIILVLAVSNVLSGIQLIPKIENPCSDPIIAVAKEKGLKGMNVKETIRYLRVERDCIKSEGNDKTFYLIESKEYQKDYEQSRYMVSWTSTFSYCVGVSIFYYFDSIK